MGSFEVGQSLGRNKGPLKASLSLGNTLHIHKVKSIKRPINDYTRNDIIDNSTTDFVYRVAQQVTLLSAISSNC